MLAHLMTPHPVTIGPEESVQRAALLMDEFNVGALPVCEDTRLIGLVTDRDITVRATAAGLNPNVTPVRLVMSSPARTCTMGCDVVQVLEIMSTVQIRRLLVVDSERQLVGIVSLGDIADRLPSEADAALRQISNPSQPDRLPIPPPTGLLNGHAAFKGARPQ